MDVEKEIVRVEGIGRVRERRGCRSDERVARPVYVSSHPTTRFQFSPQPRPQLLRFRQIMAKMPNRKKCRHTM